MPIYNNLAQYVKFVRGTPTAFSNLANKDNDTLYFISETDATTGVLYLGSKLISGSVSITDLGTVILNNLGDGDLLIYDSTQSAWVNTTPTELVGIMQGASATTNGTSGLVPIPVAGDQNKFLRGDGTWANPTVAYDSSIFTTNQAGELTFSGFEQATAGQLLTKDENGDISWASPTTLVNLTEVNERITNLGTTVTNLNNVVQGLVTNKLQRRIVNSVSSIDLNADDADQYIYMVPNGNASGNSYSEYMVIDGVLEVIGNNYEGDLTGYVTTLVFNTAVGDINTSISNIQDELRNISSQFDDYVTLVKYNDEVGNLQALTLSQENGHTLVHQVNDLTMRLTWSELS